MGEDGRVAEAFRGTARGGLTLMVGQGVSIMVRFFAVIFIARVLGASSFGVVNIAYIPIGIAMTLMNTGVNQALIKYLAEYRFNDDPGRRKVLVETGVALNLASGALLTTVTYLSSTFLAEKAFQQPELGPLIRVYSLILLGQALYSTAEAVTIGYERMTLKSSLDVVYSLLRSVAGPALVYLGWGAMGAVTGYVASTTASGLVGLLVMAVLWRMEPRDQAGEYLRCAKMMLLYGAPLFLSGVLTGATANVTNFLLALYVSPEHVGNYEVAFRFGVLVTFFTGPVATALFPLYSKLEKNPGALRLVFKDSAKYTALIIYPIIAAVIALAPQIVMVLYTEAYQYADLYLRLYMVHFLLHGAGLVGLVYLLAALKETRVVFKKSLIHVLTAVPLALWLIPRLGVPGLIASVTLGPAAGLVYGLHWVKKNRGLSIDYRATLKALAAATLGLLATIPIQMLGLHPWATVALGGGTCVIIYGASVIALKVLDRNDLDNLAELATGLGPLAGPAKRVLDALRRVA